MEKNFCVYLLASRRNGTLYVGVTSGLVKRIWQHKSGTIDGFTSKYNVRDLVWFEQHDNAESAIVREKQIKEWKRQWKRELIERQNPEWRDLFFDICGETASCHSIPSRNRMHPAWANVEGLDTGVHRYDDANKRAK